MVRPAFALNRKRLIDDNDPPAESSIRPDSGLENWKNYASALDRLSRGSFAAAVGTHFKTMDEAIAQPVWLTLYAVEDLTPPGATSSASLAVPPRRSSPAPASSGFVLVFGSSEQMPQGTRLFQHDRLGNFALFIVPEHNGGQVYTAVVNRLDQPTIVAVPFDNSRIGGNGQKNVVPATTFAPATSPDGGDPSALPQEMGSLRRSMPRD